MFKPGTQGGFGFVKVAAGNFLFVGGSADEDAVDLNGGAGGNTGDTQLVGPGGGGNQYTESRCNQQATPR
jgi:hypothetical protein